jgi:predicted ATPase/DNA-binding SARP family transcriptional activator
VAGSGSTEFRVLGSVEALLDGRTLALGGPRQQAMLALLLLEPGRAVADHRLADELWHGEPPPGAATTLRVYVSRLRSALPDAAIMRSGAGYVLDLPPERVDAHRFEQLVAEGRGALERGAARRAATLLREALELWRGRPYGGLGDEGALALDAKRLEEVHLLALEERIEAELQLGGGAELVDELEALVAQHRYRERLWHHLMLALYRSGRQADALAAYRRAQKLLDEELGVEPSEELRALEQAILRHEVPPARASEERHNLPAPLTSFVGREQELAELRALLGQDRLVTLTGVGGVGKTRLALEAARRSLPDFPDGVWFADLSALTEPELVLRAVITALDVADQVDAATTQGLADYLREADLLLVLDNCEHLRDPIGELAYDLLTNCPRLRVLATSREALGTPGEVDDEVSPLALPEAVQLFVQRARAARPRFSDDERALASVARICSDLEGLPLAVELAAARTKALSLEEIEERLADRFRFLVSWRRLATARHRTLRETMDWSWELLPPQERSLLADLSVFAGGFTLGAVAAVCVQADEERALALVERLVDASLVVAELREDRTRYRLLETVRQYAADRLGEAGGASATRDRHAAYYLELAERSSSETTERGTFERTNLDPDDANLRAALVHFEATGSTEQELRLSAALWRYWWQRGEIAYGRERLQTALGRGSGAASVRAEALRGASTLALRQGDYAAARALAEESLQLCQQLDDTELARAHVSLANALGSLGERGRAQTLYTEAAAAFRAAGRTWELANVLLNMGDLALNAGDLEAAERIVSESLSLCRVLGEEAGVAVNLGNLAFIALERGDADSAYARLAEALERSHAVGFAEWVAIMLIGLAAVATIRDEDARAAELLGAAERMLEEAGASLDSIERRVHAGTRETLRDRLGDDAFAASLESGRGLSTSAAVEVATSSL